MMCTKPYMRVPIGIDRKMTILSDEARLAATPYGCGQCLHCRINRSRIWTNRIMLELKTSTEACFVTLTYEDDHMPEMGDLEPRDLTNFLKRLRKIKTDKIRYFGVGEYGDKTLRPHYHVALFGVSILDSKNIEKCWPHGFAQIGDLNVQSARYITGYVVKKLTSKDDPRLEGRLPEFMRCSKMNGGLGLKAIEKIAEKINNNQYFKRRIIREINVGRKAMPLGRYLTDKLCELIGISQNEKDLDFYLYQDEIFVKHMNDGIFYENVRNEKEHEREVQIKRKTIYGKKKGKI